METRYVVESRETPAAQWRPWPFLSPFTSRTDAEAQAAHLASREPYPTRSWQTRPEYRVREAPAGCPRCIDGAVGPLCDWHARMARLGATVAPPRPIEPRRPIAPSPRPRRSPRIGYSAETQALLRRHHEGDES